MLNFDVIKYKSLRETESMTESLLKRKAEDLDSKGGKSLPTIKHTLADFDLVVHVSFISRVELESDCRRQKKRKTASVVY